MARPRPADLFFGVALLALGAWYVAGGDPLIGAGFALLGLAAFVAGFVPSVHDFMYRPIWRRRSRP